VDVQFCDTNVKNIILLVLGSIAFLIALPFFILGVIFLEIYMRIEKPNWEVIAIGNADKNE
jgi:hypothetical protein